MEGCARRRHRPRAGRCWPGRARGRGLGLLAAPGSAQAVTTQFDDMVEVVPPPGIAALGSSCSGSVPQSTSVGGALNLDNSGSSGAGAVLYSNRGADALGRLLVVNQANAANPQHAVRIQNAGTAHTVSIFHDPAGGAGDPTAEAVDIVSTNEQDTTLGVRGRETGKGTVKITHGKPDGSDANASALSIALEGAGTASQGIFIGNDADNPTTGDLLHIRNGGPGHRAAAADRRRTARTPRRRRRRQGADAHARRQHRFRPALRRRAAARDEHDHPRRRGRAPRLRGAARPSRPAGPRPHILQLFGATSEVTPSAPTNMPTIEVFKSDLAFSGLSGAADGLVGSTFSSFQHHMRLRPMAASERAGSPTCSASTRRRRNRRHRVSVNNYSPLRIEAPGGSGAILNLTGLEIRTSTAAQR